jgi:hypothetical protein
MTFRPNRKFKKEYDKPFKKEPVPMKSVIKEVVMHLYCHGVMPKEVTETLYNTLRLKDS